MNANITVCVIPKYAYTTKPNQIPQGEGNNRRKVTTASLTVREPSRGQPIVRNWLSTC